MYRSHRIALQPTAEQDGLFRQHAGYARLAYNWAIGEFQAGLSVGDWCRDMTLRPRFNAVKGYLWPWCVSLSQNASKGAIIDAGAAIQRWGAYRKNPAGKYVGFPNFKRRGGKMTFRADNGPDTIGFDSKYVILPVKMGGAVRMREEMRFEGRIVAVRISKRAQRWYASVTVDDGEELPELHDNGKPAIGVDAGVKSLATCSDGVVYEAPKPLRRMLKKLRRLNQALARKVKGSRNWRKQVEAIKRLHARIADVRNDALHKVSSAIAARAGSVAAETLNISGMLKNRRLSRAIADTGMSELLRQLEYKCAWGGIPFRRIDQWHPSSKLCNHCNWKNDTLTLAQREWWCGNCGAQVDRDLNAAMNIRDWPGAARSQPVEPAVSPALVPAPGCEAGTVSCSQLRLL